MKCFKQVLILAIIISTPQWCIAQEQNQQRKRHSAEEIIQMLDQDNDGKVSLAELESNERFARLSQNFDALDADSDGYITATELNTFQQEQKRNRQANESNTTERKEIGKWDNGKITIDGGVKDWGELLKYYDSNSKIMYDYSNDDEFLYLAFQVKETAIQNKIMSSGFNLNIDARTKPKLRSTIIFPVMQRQSRQRNEGPDAEMETRQQDNSKRDRSQRMEERRQLWLFMMSAIETEGFVSGVTSIAKNNGQDRAFTYEIAWDHLNQMNIEFKIPVSELIDAHEKQKSLDKIEIKIEPRVLAMESSNGQMGGRGPGMGGGPGGGGGRPSGGMGGPGGGMNPGENSSVQGQSQGQSKPDMQMLMTEQSFKFSFQLSNDN